ncbi:Uncharacterized protein HZ326_23505 [Fusarium oxysporum f. sp. albedinis]|nr:Uncharacterized protein HZ326_23505 [Fusarium oxysporum f. sp. albedinis]
MGAQDLLMVSCNLRAVSLLLSAEDLPPSLSLHLSFQSSAILNLRVFFLSTEDLPLKPISAGFASFLRTAGLLLSTEDLLPMPISAGLTILGLQVFFQVFYPRKIPCLHPSLQSIFARSSHSAQPRDHGFPSTYLEALPF